MTIFTGSKEKKSDNYFKNHMIIRKQFINLNSWNSPIDKAFLDIVPSKRPTLSWIFKSFCDATATATCKTAIFKKCFHRWSEKTLGKHPPARWQ